MTFLAIAGWLGFIMMFWRCMRLEKQLDKAAMMFGSLYVDYQQVVERLNVSMRFLRAARGEEEGK